MLSGFGKACTCVHNPPHISTLATQWQVPRDILGEGGGGASLTWRLQRGGRDRLLHSPSPFASSSISEIKLKMNELGRRLF